MTDSRHLRYCLPGMPVMTMVVNLVLFMSMYAGANPQVDLVLEPQRSFTSACLKALGDAGIALPGDISMGQNNPALLFSSCRGRPAGMLALGYGRDSLFNRHIVPVSFAHVDGLGALGFFYRFQSGDCGISQHEVTVNFSGQLFDKSDAQGAVDFGVNVRCGIISDDRVETRTLPVERWVNKKNGVSTWLSTIDSVSARYNGKSKMRQCIADIGFYQPEIMDHVDFGLVIRNIAGYQWVGERPFLTSADSLVRDSINADDTLTIVKRTYSYSDATRKTKDWLAARYRTLTAGVLYRSDYGPVKLRLPVDMEILGLFDKNMKNDFVLRVGIEAQLNELVCLRAGYARQPKTITEGLASFKNVNVFTGGLGLEVASFRFDCYFSQGAFGITAGLFL